MVVASLESFTMPDSTSRSEEDDHAARVILSFAPTDESTAEALRKDPYRTYLRRTRSGPVAVGDEWEEFVSRGCGTTRDVVLRVESTIGGDSIGPETAFAFEPRGE